MDHKVRKELLAGPWQPKVYTVFALAELLKISLDEALLIRAEINMGPDERLISDMVAHHDLVTYLKDDYAIAEVPDTTVELPRQGLWLCQQRGWTLNLRRMQYRWTDPETNLSHMLRQALMIEMVRICRESQPKHQTIQDPNIIDADFKVKH